MSETATYIKTGIGNLIVITPAMQAIASMDPSGKTDVCMAKGWKDHRAPALRDLTSSMPFVRNVFEYPGPIGQYRRFFIPLQCESSEAGRYFLHRWPGKRWPGNNWARTRQHEIEANMDIVRKMGYRGHTPPLYVPIADSPVLDLPRPIIGLCNGAFKTQSWEKKHWPYFSVLASSLKGWFGGSVIGVGGANELNDVPLTEDFCGRLPFTGSAKVISQCDLFISTDTGCMHAADALGVPTIALFGPTLTSKNAPVSPGSKVVKARVACSPCQYTVLFQTCTVYLCMISISPGEIMREARRMLK